jgi:type II secretory pathway pseudopilin PulG
MIVVVTIIMLITSVGLYQYNKASQRSRDADRQSNLSKVQAAIELYKQRNGRYPAGCNSPGAWSGQLGTSYACSNGDSRYIVGLAPDFIPTLPQERRLNGTDSGYVYTVDTAGTVYKFEARKTVESHDVTYFDSMKSCDIEIASDGGETGGGICADTYPDNSKPANCELTDDRFKKSYAVWGGFTNNPSAVWVERYTEDIICEIP